MASGSGVSLDVLPAGITWYGGPFIKAYLKERDQLDPNPDQGDMWRAQRGTQSVGEERGVEAILRKEKS